MSISIYRLSFFVFTAWFWAISAFAAPIDEGRTALESGDYHGAYEQGLALDNSAGLTLAAEALNAQLLLGIPDDPSKLAKRAMKLAGKAEALDAHNVQAPVQYAIAYGFYGRHASSFKAWRKKLPQKIYRAIEDAVLVNPKDGRMDALRGAWHLSLLYRGKKWNVEKRYGASLEVGIENFEKALVQTPDDILIVANYAVMLYVLGGPDHEAYIETLLETVSHATPNNAIERDVQTRMGLIFKTLDTDPSTAQSLAREFIGG